jgi:hypothetical protein
MSALLYVHHAAALHLQGRPTSEWPDGSSRGGPSPEPRLRVHFAAVTRRRRTRHPRWCMVADLPSCGLLQVWGSIVGMFELNNLDLQVPSPVEDYFLLIDDLPPAEKRPAQLLTQPLLDALDVDYDAPCEVGTAGPCSCCCPAPTKQRVSCVLPSHTQTLMVRLLCALLLVSQAACSVEAALVEQRTRPLRGGSSRRPNIAGAQGGVNGGCNR